MATNNFRIKNLATVYGGMVKHAGAFVPKVQAELPKVNMPILMSGGSGVPSQRQIRNATGLLLQNKSIVNGLSGQIDPKVVAESLMIHGKLPTIDRKLQRHNIAENLQRGAKALYGNEQVLPLMEPRLYNRGVEAHRADRYAEDRKDIEEAARQHLRQVEENKDRALAGNSEYNAALDGIKKWTKESDQAQRAFNASVGARDNFTPALFNFWKNLRAKQQLNNAVAEADGRLTHARNRVGYYTRMRNDIAEPYDDDINVARGSYDDLRAFSESAKLDAENARNNFEAAFNKFMANVTRRGVKMSSKTAYKLFKLFYKY